MGLSQPLLARGVGLIMQMAATVLTVQAMPVGQVATYFAMIAAANLISALSDFGFCQYAFRYMNRGVPLRRVFAAAITATLVGGVICMALGEVTAVIMDLPLLLLFAAIAGSAIQKWTSLNRNVLLVRNRSAPAMLIDGLQPTLFVLLMLAYFALLPKARSGHGTINIVGSIYAASFAIAFPISVILCQVTFEWRRALNQCRTMRKCDVRGFRRAVRRSILLAIEWNLVSLWMSFLVLWFQTAGYNYETAVLGLLQRILGIARVAIAVSLQVQLAHYYNARVTSAYLLTLAKQGLLIGCGTAVVVFSGGWAIEIGRPWFARLPITELCAELARYPLQLGVVCAVDYVFFHLSSFALGLNRKLIRVAAPAAGLAVLLSAGFGAAWLEPRDRMGFALLAYAISLFIGTGVLLIFLLRLQTRRPVRSFQVS
jgi:hypothetical protein